MEELIKNIFSGEKTTPPKVVCESLEQHFGKDVISLEWSHRDTWYEALFYFNQMEHIARFRESGDILEYRVNLPYDRFPESLLQTAESKGEVMNMVAIHYPDRLLYEVIIRDNNLIRMELIINEDSVLISEKML